MPQTSSFAAAIAVATATILIGCGKQEQPAPATPAPASPAARTAPVVTEPAKPAATTPTAPAETTSTVQEVAKAAQDQFTALVSGFQTASPETLKAVQDAVAAARNQDYKAALPLLQKAMGDAKLTPEQQNLLKQAIDAVKASVTKQVTADPAKTATDLQKSLPFGK
jgi:hypothetical protein